MGLSFYGCCLRAGGLDGLFGRGLYRGALLACVECGLGVLCRRVLGCRCGLEVGWL